MMYLKKISDSQLLNEFRTKYIAVSGLDVTIAFLRTRSVYAVFNYDNKMKGGFVLGNDIPYRTIEVFSSERNRAKLYNYIKDSGYCEINCLWLSVKYRRGLWSYWFWILFAHKVSRQTEPMLIYGTISKPMADVYGYPRKSRLLHAEILPFEGKLRNSWIFIGARKDFFVGVLETFIYKLKNKPSQQVKYKQVHFELPLPN